MIFKQSIVAAIAMLLLNFPMKAEVIANIQGDALSVRSTQAGSAGYHGCNLATAQKVPAYIFELQVQQKGDKGTTNSSCGRGTVWLSVSTQQTNEGVAIFDELPEGRYRILCLTGQAIGCTLDQKSNDLPQRSIVYHKEMSKGVLVVSPSENPSTVKTNALARKTEFSVFPNPASNELTIDLQSVELSDEVSISLIDLLGKTVHSIRQPVDQRSSNHRWIMNLHDFPPGAYFIHLQDAKGTQFSQKIVIQNNQ